MPLNRPNGAAARMSRPPFSRSAVVRGGAMVAAGGVVADGLGAALNVLLGVELGADGYGVYAFVIATAAFLGAIARLGLSPIVVRDIARSVEPAGAGLGSREPILTALGITATLAALIAIATLSPPGVAILDSLGGLDRSTVAALTLLFAASAVYAINTESLRGLHRLAAASFLGLPVQRTVVLVLVVWFVVTMGDPLTPTTAVWLTAVASVTALVASSGYLTTLLRRLPGRRPEMSRARRMARDGAPLLVSDVLAIAEIKLPIWVLASLGALADAGVYALAAAFVTVVAIARRIQNGTLAPFVASAYHNGDRGALQNRVRIAAAATSSMVIAGGIAVLIGGAFAVPWIFGSEFDDTMAVTGVLLIGAAATVLAGPCALLLNVSGNERWTAIASVITVGLAAVAIFPAAHLGGAIGGAAVMTVSAVVRSGLLFSYAKRRTGIVTSADFAALYRSLSRGRTS